MNKVKLPFNLEQTDKIINGLKNLKLRLSITPKYELLFDNKDHIIREQYANIGDSIEIQDKESKNKTKYTYTLIEN